MDALRVKRKGRKLPDYAGLIDYRKARSTGTFVGLYIAEMAHADTQGGKYITICEEHSTVINHATRQLAASHMSSVDSWCEQCVKVKQSDVR